MLFCKRVNSPRWKEASDGLLAGKGPDLRGRQNRHKLGFMGRASQSLG